MANIVFTELEGWEEEHIKTSLAGHNITLIRRPIQKQDYDSFKKVDILSPFIYTPITEELLEKIPDIKLIATRSTGFDHVDVKACAKRDIKVVNVPFYGENTVAEHTWALILSLSRKIFQSFERTEKGNFTIDGLRGFDLKGKTLGVVGCGHIGQHVVKIAKAFEMRVVVFDPKPNDELAKELGFEYHSLDALLKEADVITLHAPYNEKTHHLLNKDNMRLIKKGAVLVNTARGGLIDTLALLDVLKEGRLAGAGLDVLEEECGIREESELLSPEYHKKYDLKLLIADHILLGRDDVIITPHNAFNSQESILRILDTTIQNIKSFIEGKIINEVNPHP